MPAHIRVEGLRELRTELRRLEDDNTWKTELREAGLGAATIVANEASRTAAATSNPRMGSAAVATIRALAGQARATIAGGTASIRWFVGHEFGSIRYRQFPRKRAGGYHLYPAIGRKHDEVIEFYGKAIDRLTRRSFPG